MAVFGITVGGGPAPGINGVIGAATIVARRRGARVDRLPRGLPLADGGPHRPRPRARRRATCRGIHLLGGSILQTSRANPTKKPEHLEAVVRGLGALGVDHLITIGGDDTAFSARRVAESRRRPDPRRPRAEDDRQRPAAARAACRPSASRPRASTRRASSSHLMEDARTTGRWYLVVMMGRTAGHLALGAGEGGGRDARARSPRTSRRSASGSRALVRILEGAIVKRLAPGPAPRRRRPRRGPRARGSSPRDLEGLEDVERDEHGHIRLAEVPLGRVLRDAVRKELAAHGVEADPRREGRRLRAPLRAAERLRPRLHPRPRRRRRARAAGRHLERDDHPPGGAHRARPLRGAHGPEDRPHQGARRRHRRRASHASASSLQVRIEREDLERPENLAALASTLGVAPEQARARYEEAL